MLLGHDLTTSYDRGQVAFRGQVPPSAGESTLPRVGVEGLDLAAARYRLGLQTAGALRELGVSLLAAGHDQALQLAIADDLDGDAIGVCFERLCHDLGRPAPALDEAIERVTEAILRDITEARTPPEAGLQRLMLEVVAPHVWGEDELLSAAYVGASRGLHHLVGAHYGYDDLRERPDTVSNDGRYGEEAIALLDRQVVSFARDWLAGRERLGPRVR